MVNYKNCLQKRSRHTKYRKDTKDVGSHLKRRRLAMKRNQDWVAKGICSVSYLSKIENNNIEFNHGIVREIMERLELDPILYQVNEHDEQYLKQVIQALYFYDGDVIASIYKDVKDVEHSLTINLIKLANMLMTNHKDTKQYVTMLEQVIMNMSDLDLQTFLVLGGLYYKKEHQYLAAFEMMMLALEVNQEDESLRAIACASLFDVKQHLHMKNSSFKYLLEAKRLFSNHNNIRRLMKLKMLEVAYMIEEHPAEANKILNSMRVEHFEALELEEYYLLLSKSYIRLSNVAKAERCLSKVRSESKHSLEKLFLTYKIAKDHSLKMQLSSQIDQTKTSKDNMHIMIAYRLMKEESISKRKEYLKDVAIPYAKKVANFDLFFQYVKDMTEICMITSRYKEATQYIQAYVKAKEKTHQYIEDFYAN